MNGAIFSITTAPGGMTTETCRRCPFSITYRERPTPQQRSAKYQHTCPTPTSQEP